MSIRYYTLDLAKLRRMDALGLAKHRTIAVQQVASITRRLATDLDTEQRARCVAALGHWQHVPEMIACVERENMLGARDEWDRLRGALERAVRIMFEADAGEDDNAFDAAYQQLRECHQRINNYLQGDRS